MKNGGASGPYSFHVGMASTAQGRAAVFRLPEAEPPPTLWLHPRCAL